MDQVAQVREKIDIVSFLSEYLTLKKAGRNFKAVCPFHNEKTPSFVVSPERQIWHCFGCGKGGDIYTFLMEYERLEFPEALRLLAKRAGIQLVSRNFEGVLTSKKERLYQINALAKEYYHFVLTKHLVGKPALSYVRGRGIDPKVIDTFGLGFAPARGNGLVKYLIDKKRFAKEEVIDAGLAFQSFGGLRTRKDGDLVDFFRGRLIFPLIDHRDNVVGFAGRVLDDSSTTAKYINTRETLIYHKGEHIYGFNITKDAIRREEQAIIVEGEFDVLSCFQNGVANVIAVKGTALTEQQVNLLARFTKKITFCFDGDKPGQEAIKRSLTIVEKKGITPTVIEIPDKKDPDEALRENPTTFKIAVKNDISVYDYLLSHALEDNDTDTAAGKKKVADALLPFVAQISNEIIKEHYLKKLADGLSTTYESIVKEAERIGKAEAKHAQPSRVASTEETKRSKEEILEEYLLALIVQSEKPKTAIHKAVAVLSGSVSRERAYHKIMDHLLDHVEGVEKFDGKKFADGLPKELVPAFDSSSLFPLPNFLDEEHILKEVENAAQKLRVLYIQEKMKKLAAEIKRKEQEGEEREIKELQKQYSDLASNLHAS